MTLQPISDKLFGYLLSDLGGDRFEQVAKKIFAAEHKEEFVPLGGMHDGGADGLLASRIYEGHKPNTYFQFSVTDEERAKNKIEKTIESLRKAGRDPKRLVYATTELLPKHDIITADIHEKHDVLVTIKDRERIKQIVNTNAAAQRVFFEEFSSDIDALMDSKKNRLGGQVNEFVSDPTIFAFLDYQLRDRFSKDHLNDKILEALIYWALRNTDPDKERFMTQNDIGNEISKVLPTATKVLLPLLAERLKVMSHKVHGDFERVRHHRARNLYCLPFAMRKELVEQAVAEKNLQEDFLVAIKDRFKAISSGKLNDEEIELATKLNFLTVHEYFVEQGMLLSAFLQNKLGSIGIADQIVEDDIHKVISRSDFKQKLSPELISCCMRVLKGIFYGTSDIERKYLEYLSRTSMLFMTLQSSPRVIEYFNRMAGNFRLLVGTDLLIKAISEQYLDQPYRDVENLLRICSEMGARLVLAEPVLNEVFTHLHAVDLEYQNHYLPNEAYLSPEEVAECDRILIRAFYYARTAQTGPRTWTKLIESLLSPDALRAKSEKGRLELKALLMQRFRMDFISTEELERGTSKEGRTLLARQLFEVRPSKHEELSVNDALMTYAVFAQRKAHQESGIYDGFGYRTWWLTKETYVLSFTGALVQKEGGVPYIMRPEFLLNFIALAPHAADVREKFRELLPTTVGLQLGQHLKPEVMQQLLAGTEEWASLSPERRSVMIAEKVNRLKFDRFKRYTANLE